MYIEREALIDLITEKFQAHYGNTCYQFIHDFFRCVVKLIRKAPTVDVAPIVYSNVKVETTVFKSKPNEVWVRVLCEKCGKVLWCERYDKNEWDEYMKDHFKMRHDNYCADCGAKLHYN